MAAKPAAPASSSGPDPDAVPASLAARDNAALLNVTAGFVPRALSNRLTRALCRDPRDAPILELHLELVAFLAVSSSLVLWSGAHWAALLAHFVPLYVFYTERFILMLHFAEHRAAFKHALLNEVGSAVLAPFFGIPPGLYRLHHVAMHHVENNGSGDLSGTEPYDRSRFSEFLRYWWNFWTQAWLVLPPWAMRNGRRDLLLGAAPAWAAWALALLLLRPPLHVVAWLLVAPHCVTMFLLAFGNWSQHVFVNPDLHRDNSGLTYDITGSDFNSRVFNDGYHLVHHANSRAHWSELPQRFAAGLAERRSKDAFVFTNLDFFMVGFFATVWPGDGGLYRLARNHFVWYGQRTGDPAKRAKGEETAPGGHLVQPVVAEMKRRLQRIS